MSLEPVPGVPPTSTRTRRYGFIIASILLSVLILGSLLYRERGLLLSYDWHIRWGYLLAAGVVFLPALVLTALTWADLMRKLGSRVSFVDHCRYYILAHAARRLPGTVWYVAGRGYLYRQHGDSLRLVTLSSGLELIISVSAGALVTVAFGTLVLAQLPRTYWIGLALTIGGGLAITHPAVIRRLLRRMHLPDAPQLRYGSIVSWLLAYAVIWIAGGGVLFLVLNALVPVPLRDLPYVVGVWCLVGTASVLVFFLPSNLGFTEVGLSVMLSAIVPSGLAIVGAILTRIVVTGYELLALGLVLRFMPYTPPPPDADRTPPAQSPK